MLLITIQNPRMHDLSMLKRVNLRKYQREPLCAKFYKSTIVSKNVIRSDGIEMHKEKRPCNYFSNSFTYCQAEQIKEGRSVCPNSLARTHGIFLFKVKQFHLHTCLVHSNAIFIL